MIDRELLAARSVQVALGALVLAVVFSGWSLTRAVRIDPVPPGAPLRFSTAGAVMTPDPTTPPDVVSVVSLNVFAPERTAPARRYRLAGYAQEKPSAEAPKPVVLGTALSTPERSFAIVKVGDVGPQIVRMGNTIAGYTVKSIERGLVVFAASTGERLAISAGKQ